MLAERHFVVRGLKIHCFVGGEGPPLVLLHGAGPNSAEVSYAPTMGPLSKRFRVFAPDFPGYGLSDKPRLPYTTAFYAAFLGPLLDALGLGKADLVGSSMGGGAAMGFALRYPERVGRLVLAGSYGYASRYPLKAPSFFLAQVPWLDNPKLAFTLGNRTVVNLVMRDFVYQHRRVQDELVTLVREQMLNPGAWRSFRSWTKNELLWAGRRTNYMAALRHLETPTLILHGQKDRLEPVRFARLAGTIIPDCTTVVYPKTGHWVIREKPKEFVQAVITFTGGESPRRAA
ncbi:MAG: alpha/beta fold hydrolase [Candidatus Aquicultorales bacterium]